MNPLLRLLALTLFILAAPLGFAASLEGDAQTPGAATPKDALPLVPLLDEYSWQVPLVMGDYIAVPGGDSTTLGAMTIGVTPDNRGIVGGAIYFYDSTGKMVTQGINGSITYASDDELVAGAPLARTTLTAYTLSNGPPRGSSDSHPHQATPTSDVITWAWSGPREGVLTVNGRTQQMVHVWSGPPAVAPIDYSGVWLFVSRVESAPTPPSTVRDIGVQLVATVKLAHVAPIIYAPRSTAQQNTVAWPTIPLPSPDAQFYSVECVSQGCALSPTSLMAVLGSAVPYDVQQQQPLLNTMWLGSSGSGYAMVLSRETTPPVLYYWACEISRVYGDNQRIFGRERCLSPAVVRPFTREFALFRLGPNTLDSRFDLVPCRRSDDPGFDCNPYRRPYPGQPRD